MKDPTPVSSIQISDRLFQDLRSLIIEARQDVSRQVNSALVLLYWRVGKRIRQDILKEKRAEYGEQIVSTLSTQLVSKFGSSFSIRNLWHMLRFAEVFPDEKIVNALSTQLGWTLRHIITFDDTLQEKVLVRLRTWEAGTVRSCLFS